jgi:predicted DNA binding CopG/RHH family protein
MIEEQEQQPTQDLWEYEFEGKKYVSASGAYAEKRGTNIRLVHSTLLPIKYK